MRIGHCLFSGSASVQSFGFESPFVTGRISPLAGAGLRIQTVEAPVVTQKENHPFSHGGRRPPRLASLCLPFLLSALLIDGIERSVSAADIQDSVCHGRRTDNRTTGLELPLHPLQSFGT